MHSHDCLCRRWSHDRALVDSLSCRVEHACLQEMYTPAVEDRYLFLEERPPRGSVGREVLSSSGFRSQALVFDFSLQSVLVSLPLSTLGSSSMLKLAVKDYFGDTSVVHACDVTNPTESSWHHYRLDSYHVVYLQDFSIRDLVLPLYTTLSDLGWLSEILNDTKRRTVSLRQLSYLFYSSFPL